MNKESISLLITKIRTKVEKKRGIFFKCLAAVGISFLGSLYTPGPVFAQQENPPSFWGPYPICSNIGERREIKGETVICSKACLPIISNNLNSPPPDGTQGVVVIAGTCQPPPSTSSSTIENNPNNQNSGVSETSLPVQLSPQNPSPSPSPSPTPPPPQSPTPEENNSASSQPEKVPQKPKVNFFTDILPYLCGCSIPLVGLGSLFLVFSLSNSKDTPSSTYKSSPSSIGSSGIPFNAVGKGGRIETQTAVAEIPPSTMANMTGGSPSQGYVTPTGDLYKVSDTITGASVAEPTGINVRYITPEVIVTADGGAFDGKGYPLGSAHRDPRNITWIRETEGVKAVFPKK